LPTIYFEQDDEITTAISRIRAVTGPDAVAVVPPGSRIATSRINFKLLAREAAERHMNIVAVSDEPQVRALAISAGLPAYDSITAAERALATFRDQDRRLNDRLGRTMPREHPDPGSGSDASGTRVMPVANEPPSVAARRTTGYDAVPVDTAVLPAQQAATAARSRGRRRVSIAPLLVLGLLLLLVAGVAYGAYVFLPTATITVRPLTAAIRAPDFTVTADPNVAVIDTAAGVIPAEQVSVPVHVEGSFTATGIESHDTRAAGSVRFRSENTVNPVSVPANTVVSTRDGIEFVTLADVVLPKASFATGPTTADVEVRAVKGGPKGNVDANTITVEPASLSQAVVTVTNAAPTTGGKHIDEQVVSQEDYEAALSSLSGQLPQALTIALADPESVPRGLVAYPATAQLSAGQPDQPAESVVGVVEPSFILALDATADVTAVNVAQIDEIAAARLRAALAAGQKLVSDDVTASHDGGTVVGDTVLYTVTASGAGYTNPDPQTVIAAVRGKSLADARSALGSLGTADIDVWPDFVDHLPDQTARINVTVIAPSAGPSAAPGLAPTSVPSASPS
jgi:hypothetical protein